MRAGVYANTFKKALPANYDRGATHAVGGEMSREKGKQVANLFTNSSQAEAKFVSSAR